MPAKVVVACGSGIATSEAVAAKLRKLLAARSVEADIVAVDLESLEDALQDACAYVSVIKTEQEYDLPVFNGVAFLTGMGQAEELDRLIDAITA